MKVVRIAESGMNSSHTRLVTFVCGAALVLLVYWQQVSDVATRAASRPDQGYTFIVPLVAAYLVLIRKSRLRGSKSIRGARLGCLLVIASIALSWIGYQRDILVLWQAAPIIALIGLLVAFLGIARCRGMAPGLVILFAALPIPGTIQQWISQPLQGLATSVTAVVLDLFGVAAVRTGNLIEINGVPVAVGEACNGMRLVMPLAIVIFAFVFSLPLRPVTRMVLLVLSLPVALTCNIARLIPTALAYGYWPERATELHDLLGWSMIPLAILMMLGVLRAFEWLDLPVARLRLALS